MWNPYKLNWRPCSDKLTNVGFIYQIDGSLVNLSFSNFTMCLVQQQKWQIVTFKYWSYRIVFHIDSSSIPPKTKNDKRWVSMLDHFVFLLASQNQSQNSEVTLPCKLNDSMVERRRQWNEAKNFLQPIYMMNYDIEKLQLKLKGGL